ncbi:MAG: hypothetical protein P8Y24_09240 [Gammaproteobacteria bacterium]
MLLRQLSKRILVTAGLLMVLPFSINADEQAGPVEVPKARAKATQEFGCVAPVEEMRKSHMQKLLHKRDKTLREGVRTKDISLAECIDCHVTKDEKTGAMPSFGDDKHFCSSCHNYAAVKVDCFQCHNDKPENQNYKHSLTDNPLKAHHKDLALNVEASKKSLNKETLDVVTSGGSK